MRTLIVAMLASLAVASPAQAAETVTTLPNESWIKSYGDRHLVQVRDEHGYHLAVIDDGELVELYEIAPSRFPFEADIGGLRHGEPAIVYSRCADGLRRRCDLHLHVYAGAGVRKLRAANSAASEDVPTLSGGRVAWVRRRSGRPPVVLTRRLGSRGRSRVVRVAPRRPETVIQGLELEGRRLGVDLIHFIPRQEVQGREVRLADVRGGRNRVLARGSAGNQGQNFGGLSFWGDWFGWHRSCWELECDGLAYRHRLRDGMQQVAESPNFAGFALNRGGYLGVLAGERIDNDGCSPDPHCAVLRERGVRWRRHRR